MAPVIAAQQKTHIMIALRNSASQNDSCITCDVMADVSLACDVVADVALALVVMQEGRRRGD